MIYLLSAVAVFGFWFLCFLLGRAANGSIEPGQNQSDYVIKAAIQGFWMLFFAAIVICAPFYLFYQLFKQP
jgi:heme/copper-type cytochrome/quinol oxidase subunit 3